MRWLHFLLCVVGFAPFACAETRVTVAQLEQFLTSRQSARKPDDDIADRLRSVRLSEQLTAQSFARIESEARLGPKTIEQLRLLADSSIFGTPPSEELPRRRPPDETTQRQMVDKAVEYVDTVLHRLPDFLAIRATDSFDNLPKAASPGRTRRKAELHLVRMSNREIAYRNGHELAESISVNPTTAGNISPPPSSLTTWGEFGPILKTVLSDAFKGSVLWNRWQLSESGPEVAVFRYTVPRSASHYVVDFCCYRSSEDDPTELSFSDKPGYHGELYLDPITGAIDRITLQADLNEADPVMVTSIAVQYGKVKIAGKDYIAPVRGVAVLEVHNLVMELKDGVGPEKHINEIRFSDYHKFGSTTRILTGADDSNPH